MHIIYGVDDNFIPLLSVSISSVLHTMQGETLHFHILSMGCKKENEEKLRHFIEGEGQKISFYELEEKLQELKKRCFDFLFRECFRRMLRRPYILMRIRWYYSP